MTTDSISLASTPDNGSVIVTFVENFARDNQIKGAFRDKLMLVVSEAATNGMEHGNGYDPAKMVQIRLSLLEKGVEIQVEDEGEGFSTRNVPDPLAEENLLETSGRGLYLIELLSDEVHYEKGGRVVKLILNFEE